MESVKQLIDNKKAIVNPNTVNSSTVNGSFNNNLNNPTVNSMVPPESDVKFRHLSETEEKLVATFNKVYSDSANEVGYHALNLATYFNDMGNIHYYRFLVKNNVIGVLYLCLGLTKEAQEMGLIKKSAFLYFKAILKAKDGITEKKDLMERYGKTDYN